MTFFTSSGDIRPQFGSILDNLTTSEFNAGLIGPGSWGCELRPWIYCVAVLLLLLLLLLLLSLTRSLPQIRTCSKLESAQCRQQPAEKGSTS